MIVGRGIHAHGELVQRLSASSRPALGLFGEEALLELLVSLRVMIPHRAIPVLWSPTPGSSLPQDGPERPQGRD